jgi:hypothetical protein
VVLWDPGVLPEIPSVLPVLWDLLLLNLLLLQELLEYH